jgi:cobalt-factor III methyltransferase
MNSQGKLFFVSVGPGFSDLISPLAERALKTSEFIVGYDLYLTWIAPWIEGKQIRKLPLRQESERAAMSIELARSGRIVSLVSSGDVGAYGMAALGLEFMSEEDVFQVEIVPGISAASSCASLLGAPLSHDYATLSLSDLLCPWELIERRARQLARADLVIALYNVQSKTRRDGVYRIFDIFLEHKPPTTVCGIVRNAYRPGQEHFVCSLSDLFQRKFDMLTTVIIGNKFTYRKREFIYTARGYNNRGVTVKGSRYIQSELAKESALQEAVWVFAGTADGNALASRIAESGARVVVSTATFYGRELALIKLPGVPVRSGRIGIDARRRELQVLRARAIVDATHPFAAEISAQLIGLAKELHIPYLRFERKAGECPESAILCESMGEAAAKAIAMGKRIFLATGSKDLQIFLSHPGASVCDWFVRVAPEPESLERALSLGLPRERIFAMQGPCSRELNEALWKDWEIDCVITKESGAPGGFSAKATAAHSLGIPLIVVNRPRLDYPAVAKDLDSVMNWLQRFPGVAGANTMKAKADNQISLQKRTIMKIPVTIVTGFLGSGKTTLICGLLKKNPDRRLAVLVNEFGEVSVDAALLRTAGEECGVEIHDLPNGCICCTIKDDFLPVMKQLQSRKYEVEHVLIETSGLALPAPVMRALAWPEIRNDFHLDSVLAVVDTPQLLRGNFETGKPIPGAASGEPGAASGELPDHAASVDLILNQQLENADVVVLNKIDALEDEALIKAEELVRLKATKVRFLELAYHAELDTRLCMGLNLHDTDVLSHEQHHHGPVTNTPAEPDRPLRNQSQFDGHSHTGLGAHQHGEHTHEHFHEHDTGWQSFVLRAREAQNSERLKAAVREVTLQQPILRAKGFASIMGTPHRLVIQAVRNRIQAYFEQNSPDISESSIVFIGYHPNRELITGLMSELTHTEWH